MAKQRYIKVNVTLEDNSVISVDSLDISFNVRKSDKSETNSAEVTIYDMTREHNNAIVSSKKGIVEIFAGYMDETIGLVFKGDIQFATHVYSDVVKAVQIIGKDGLSMQTTKTQLIEIDDPCSDYQVLQKTFEKFGLDQSTIPRSPNGMTWKQRDNYSKSGSINDILEDICKDYKMSYTFNNNDTIIFSSNVANSSQAMVFMNEENGMIGSPKRYKGSKAPNSTGTQEQNTAQPEETFGYNVTSLLNAQIQPNAFMEITSLLIPITAKQRIVSVTYSGTNRADGDFICNIESVDVAS